MRVFAIIGSVIIILLGAVIFSEAVNTKWEPLEGRVVECSELHNNTYKEIVVEFEYKGNRGMIILDMPMQGDKDLTGYICHLYTNGNSIILSSQVDAIQSKIPGILIMIGGCFTLVLSLFASKHKEVLTA